MERRQIEECVVSEEAERSVQGASGVSTPLKFSLLTRGTSVLHQPRRKRFLHTEQKREQRGGSPGQIQGGQERKKQ